MYEDYTDHDPFDDCSDPEEYIRQQKIAHNPDWLEGADMTEEEYWDSHDFD